MIPDFILELDLTAKTVLVFRILMVPMILYILSFTFIGFYNTLRGRLDPTTVYRTAIFFASSALLGFQGLALGNIEPVGSGPGALALVLLLILFCLTVIVGRYMSSFSRFDDFIWIFESGRIEVASRAVLLYNLKPEMMEELLTKAEGAAVEDLVG